MTKNIFVLSLFATPFFVACGQTTQPAKSSDPPLRAELVRLSGSSAIDCGFVALDDSPSAGWVCALAADKAQRPFWFAVEKRGVDSDVWEAIGRDIDNQRFRLEYDSNPYGRPGLLPRFIRDACPGDFAFRPDEDEALSCYRNAR